MLKSDNNFFISKENPQNTQPKIERKEKESKRYENIIKKDF